MKETSNSALIGAIESNLFSLVKLLGQWPNMTLHDTPELMWSISEVLYPNFNSVLRPRLPAATVDDVIDTILAQYTSRNIPNMWWLGPSAEPEDLGQRLSDRGLHSQVSPGMALDLSTLPENYPIPKELQIKRVENEEELAIWSRVLTHVFGMPDFVTDAMYDVLLHLGFDSPLLNYAGFIDHEVVAISSVFLGAGVAGIYNVGTVESARRKGIGAAMTAIPLLEARVLGYRVGALESSESGFNVYHKLGFQEYCKFSTYIWMGDE